MSAHNELGKAGEDAAVDCLAAKGYTILERNWRRNKLELDIVAFKDGVIVVVEVKTRRNTDYNEPQDAVDEKKIRHIVRAADAYLKTCEVEGDVRFDIITAIGEEGNFRVEHIEDAFYPPLF